MIDRCEFSQFLMTTNNFPSPSLKLIIRIPSNCRQKKCFCTSRQTKSVKECKFYQLERSSAVYLCVFMKHLDLSNMAAFLRE